MSSAIGLVNRYCNKLPRDAFTKSAPISKIEKAHVEGTSEVHFQCYIKLPINSVIKDWVTGEQMPTKNAAKMATALEICKILYEKGELDDHLLPISHKIAISDDEDEDIIDVTDDAKQKKRVFFKKIAPPLFGMPPSAGNDCYIYMIKTELIQLKPSTEEVMEFFKFNPANISQSFGIISTKKIPLICSFDIFNKCGKLEVTLKEMSQHCITTTQEGIAQAFQETTFSELLDLEETMLVHSPKRAGFSYYVIALSKTECSNWIPDWEFMKNVNAQHHKNTKQNPKKCKEYKETEYKDAVLKRVYDKENPHPCYVVGLTGKTAKSKFVTEEYSDHVAYFKNKYGMQITNFKQPLLECLYCDKPPLAVPNYLDRLGAVRLVTKRPPRTLNLLPEICVKQALPGTMRKLSVCLPLILHRLNSILTIDSLRKEVSAETGIGQLLTSKKEDKLEFSWKTAGPAKQSSTKKYYGYGELATFHSETHENISALLQVESSPTIPSMRLDIDVAETAALQPPIRTLLSAVTALNADDFLNLERLETVGDAFLKYATSMYSFHKHPQYDEGRLTSLKMTQISNANLCRLGIKKKIPERMIYSKFEPWTNWRPPGFIVGEPLEEILSSFTGSLKVPGNPAELKLLSVNNLKVAILESKGQKRTLTSAEAPCVSFTDLLAQSRLYQHITNKHIANCVEALIGSYVIHAGNHAALLFMSWIGLKVLPLRPAEEASLNHAPLERKFMPIVNIPSAFLIESDSNREKMNQLLMGFQNLETTIGYTFKDRSFLLQAFTHSSYNGVSVTDCYQRLEFLGDAVLDYIITRHLYTDPLDFGPGELSDLRQALVNNIFFGMLAVKYGFHKYIKYAAPALLNLIGDFARRVQESETKDLLQEIIIEEEGCEGAEDVEVPKVLGDVVESLAGAIFLDSGMSFDVVWTIFRRLVAEELEIFRHNIPKNPVRQLLELFPKKGQVVFENPKITNSGKVNVTVLVPEGLKFCGYGTNKKTAKSTAAKRALKHFIKK